MDFLDAFTFDAELLHPVKELLIVLGIGLLLGLEREYAKQDKEVRLFAGVRTFPIVALSGYLATYLSAQFSFLIFFGAFLSLMLLAGISYYLGYKNDMGTTTEFSLIITFLLGSLVYAGNYHLAVTVAVLVTGLLTLKLRLHEAVHQLSQKDIFSILYFVIITALVLPLLPNEDYGPYGIFNPYKIWLIVAIFVGLNFLAYFFSKFFDPQRSILLTGIFGGFASSTATAWYFSRESGKEREGGALQAAAIILASSIMFPRLLIWLLLLNYDLLNILWLPVLLFGLFGIVAGYMIGRQKGSLSGDTGHRIENPINLKEAAIFAVAYVGIRLLVGLAGDRFGDEGIYLAAGISGLTDIDAITISIAGYSNESLGLEVAAAAVLLAAFSNTLVKYSFCLLFGSRRLKRYVSYVFIPLFFFGIVYIAFQLRTVV